MRQDHFLMTTTMRQDHFIMTTTMRKDHFLHNYELVRVKAGRIISHPLNRTP